MEDSTDKSDTVTYLEDLGAIVHASHIGRCVIPTNSLLKHLTRNGSTKSYSVQCQAAGMFFKIVLEAT
jgi:hypothetical protein